MHRNEFSIYDLQWLMCHTTKPNQIKISGTTFLNQSETGSDVNKRVLGIPKRSRITCNLIIRLFSVITRTLVGGVLYCSRYAVCILPPQPTWPLVAGVLPLSRDAVSVFYSPQPTRPLGVEVLPTSRDAVGVFYNPSRIDPLIIKWTC